MTQPIKIDGDTYSPVEGAARRAEGEPMESWRPRRDALARQLAGLAPVPGGAQLDALAQQVSQLVEFAEREAGARASLAAVVEGQQEELKRLRVAVDQGPAEIPRLVTLADQRSFSFVSRDVLTLCLAVTVAARTGEAVDVPLADGTVAEGLRLGELAEISRQLIGGGE